MVGQAHSSSITSKALRRIRRWGPGRVFVPRDLHGLGSRSAVDVALHRLLAAGKIRRLGRGVYDYPKQHPRFGGLTPAADDIAQAIARSTGETLVHSGSTAANLLGLSTQVPARPVYLTDGRTRDVCVGNQVLRFKHAAPSRMLGGNTPAGLVLRALALPGADALGDDLLTHLRRTLSDADRRSLQRLRAGAPARLRAVIDDIARAATDESGKRQSPEVVGVN